MVTINDLIEKLQKNMYRDVVKLLVTKMADDIEASRKEMQTVKSQFDALSGLRTQEHLDLYVKVFTLNERSQLQAQLLEFIKVELEARIEQE
jgi:hypothetical protein